MLASRRPLHLLSDKDEPCLLAGDMLAAGKGTTKDAAKARETWKAGCEAAKKWADKPDAQAVCKRVK